MHDISARKENTRGERHVQWPDKRRNVEYSHPKHAPSYSAPFVEVAGSKANRNRNRDSFDRSQLPAHDTDRSQVESMLRLKPTTVRPWADEEKIRDTFNLVVDASRDEFQWEDQTLPTRRYRLQFAVSCVYEILEAERRSIGLPIFAHERLAQERFILQALDRSGQHSPRGCPLLWRE